MRLDLPYPTGSTVKSMWSLVWPILIVLVVIVGSVLKWNSSLKEQYSLGFEAGKKELAKKVNDQADVLEGQFKSDKEKIENDAINRIAKIQADADESRNAADRLRQRLNNIRSIAGAAGATVGSGQSTEQAINLLADLLEKSNDRATEYARFADSAFEAGTTCVNQYNQARGRINETKNAKTH